MILMIDLHYDPDQSPTQLSLGLASIAAFTSVICTMFK